MRAVSGLQPPSNNLTLTLAYKICRGDDRASFFIQPIFLITYNILSSKWDFQIICQRKSSDVCDRAPIRAAEMWKYVGRVHCRPVSWFNPTNECSARDSSNLSIQTSLEYLWRERGKGGLAKDWGEGSRDTNTCQHIWAVTWLQPSAASFSTDFTEVGYPISWFSQNSIMQYSF